MVQMEKLIKLSPTHYVVVDDSEINDGEWLYDETPEKGFDEIRKLVSTKPYHGSGYWKITHSTKPLNESTQPNTEFYWNTINKLSLSEVEEAINGYNVKKMAEDYGNIFSLEGGHRNYAAQGWLDGFKAHQELVKDKLFTEKDLFNYSQLICEKLPQLKQLQTSQADDYGNNLNVILKIQDEFIQSLLPKTEWDIEFDEQGKINLL